MKIGLGIPVALVFALGGCSNGSNEEPKAGPAPAATVAAGTALDDAFLILEGTYSVCYVADLAHGDTTGDHFAVGDTFNLEFTADPEAKLTFTGAGEIKELPMIKVMPDKKLVGLVQRGSFGHKDNSGNAVAIEHVVSATMLPDHKPNEHSKCKAGEDVLDFKICWINPKTNKMDCGEDGDYGHVHGDPT